MLKRKEDNIKFVRIKCKHCEFDQILYTKATSKVKCFNCQKTLITPKGGKCEIVGATITERLK